MGGSTLSVPKHAPEGQRWRAAAGPLAADDFMQEHAKAVQALSHGQYMCIRMSQHANHKVYH